MQTKKIEVERKIYKGALEIFKEKGYKSATMKEISKSSGVPIGNIYRYYQNKEILFDEIVFEVYSRIKFIHNHEELETGNPNFNDKPRVFLSRYIALATSKPMEFSILFNSSEGTKYEKFIDELVDIRWEKYAEYLKTTDVGNRKIDKDFIMILIKSAITSTIGISKKYSNNEKLLRYYLMKFDYFFKGGIRETGKTIKFYTKD